MRTIYLYDENYSKIIFEYENISDLKIELKKIGITIGYGENI
jgi:hypothetical protein